jgi:hypothetical protein
MRPASLALAAIWASSAYSAVAQPQSKQGPEVDALGMGVKTTYYYGGPTKNELYAVVTFAEIGKDPGTTEFYVHSIPITIPATSKVQPFTP